MDGRAITESMTPTVARLRRSTSRRLTCLLRSRWMATLSIVIVKRLNATVYEIAISQSLGGWSCALLGRRSQRSRSGSFSACATPFDCAAHSPVMPAPISLRPPVQPLPPPVLRANRKAAALRSARNTLPLTQGCDQN